MVPLTSFVGRDSELAEIARLLAEHRLVTLTGAGGCGKSRLAVEATGRLHADFPDGVWIVELGALTDPRLAAAAVVSAMGVPERRAHPTDAIAEYLGPRSVLLVLDNCEHLLEACAELVEVLLGGCPRLRVLVTSREGLGVPGEMVRRVPPLALPDLANLPPPDHLGSCEAVRLFVERAQLVRHDFRLTEATAGAVAQICVRLDGMPLAIELAAARVRTLAPSQIAARVDDRFRFLAGSRRAAVPRHRTLRAAMDWSYDLLTQRERTLLSRLSVFAGRWTLDAAEAICAGGDIPAEDVLDGLTSLTDKSLVTAEPLGDEVRYGLLETVRQYARERLNETGAADVTRQAHRNWYLRFAERAEAGLRGPDHADWVRRLEADHDNLRAALEWSIARDRGGDGGPRLAWALTWFWLTRGHAAEGREWLERIDAACGVLPPALRAKVWCADGALAERLGEYEPARRRLEQSLAVFRRVNEAWGAGFALHFLGHVAHAQTGFAESTRAFEESLAAYRTVGDQWGSAFSLNCWGDALVRQGDNDRAGAVYEESVALFRAVGDEWETPGPLSGLGLVAAARGDYGRAAMLLEESLVLARRWNLLADMASAQLRLGRVVSRQGDHARAAALFRESFMLRYRQGDRDGVAACLVALAGVRLATNRPHDSARLFGAAEALREAIGTSVSPAQRSDYDRQVAALHSRLGRATLATAWGEGRAMGVDEFLAAVPDLEASGAPAPGSPDTGPDVSVLTPRERQVAALIAEGLTNRDIAARLVIAERTADGHVENILNKLGFRGRAQIAAWAVAHGIGTSTGV